ncbi:MAG TPA: hypothetical protein PKE45_06530 [Caldilineaceae bacterium]|nr:hypothetical protein [Caldilineaceae bacterium]
MRAVKQSISGPLVERQPRPVGATKTATWSATGNWGQFPILSVVAAGGLLIIALANTGSKAGVSQAEGLFWLGLLVLFTPVAARLLAAEVSRQERIGLILLLGVTLYLVKVMHSPFAFTFADELVHLYNAKQVAQHQLLFLDNPILPVTPRYPGLETVTAALSSISGLPLFYAGLTVIGVARVLMLLALYLFFEQISRSMRVAGIATLIFMAHPNFLFWSVQFSYESLSLPLAVLVLFVAARRAALERGSSYRGLTILALLGIGAVVATHHLSAYLLTLFLILWTLVHFDLHCLLGRMGGALLGWYAGEAPTRHLLRTGALIGEWLRQSLRKAQGADGGRGPAGLALFALAASVTWLLAVANQTGGYLSPVLSNAALSVIHLLIGEESGRQLFVSSSGYVAPLWERVIGIGSVLFCLVGLPFGLWAIWQRYRSVAPAPALVLAGAAMAYFAMLGLRFTPAAWETGNRASAYLFVGLSFILALAIVACWLSARTTWASRTLVVGYLAVILMGGIIAGWPPKLRLSQPYFVEASGQIVEPQGLAVADWAATVLGPNHRMVADVTNGRLLLAYGEQVGLTGRANFRQLLMSDELDPQQIHTIQSRQIEYAVVDRRRISWDNMAGYYFDRTGGSALPSADLLDPQVYEKFEREPGVDRVLDSGNIVIYDLGVFNDLPDPQ